MYQVQCQLLSHTLAHAILVSPFYKCGKCNLELLSNLAHIAQQVRIRAMFVCLLSLGQATSQNNTIVYEIGTKLIQPV